MNHDLTRHYRELMRGVYAGRPWISTANVLVRASKRAGELLELGASSVLSIGASRGTGPLPDPERCPQIDLGCREHGLMEALRAGQNALANVDSATQARVDAFDPELRAQAIGNLLSDGRPVAKRRMFGARRSAWQQLEDKTRNDELWEEADVRHAPSWIVPANLDSLRRAIQKSGLEECILAGDSRQGFNGGGTYVRWVRDEASLEEAARFFSPRCDRVRVMPFLAGIPCSIHGIVTTHHVAALRPCEMVVLQDPETPRFVYAGSSSFWDAPEALAQEMREVALRVGRTLREKVGYRGTFTVDGVATAQGFRPTELNPRFGAALSAAVDDWEELPLYLLNVVICEGLELDYRLPKLERWLLEMLSSRRNSRASLALDRPVEEERGERLVCTDTGWRQAEPAEAWDASYTLGPGPAGGFLRVTLNPERTPHGPYSAPRIAEVLGYLSTELELGLGTLRAAPEAPASPWR